MFINSIEYTNFKGLKTGRIDFDPRLTVVVGKNGSGKSSVLQAVGIVVSWIIARVRSEKSNGNYIEELSITNGHQNAQVVGNFKGIGQLIIPNRAKSGIPKQFSINLNDIREYVAKIRERLEITNYHSSVPVFALYGVKRAVIDIPLRIRNTEEHMLETYKDCLKGAANFRDFFMWFRNQEDLENEERIADNDAHRSRELEAFRRAMTVFMPEYTQVRVRRRPLRMVVNKDGEEFNIAQLSDGEKIYLALIGDMCRKLALANPDMTDPLQGEGIVMIDEVDLHLHPKWQAEIAERLIEVFPNVQFIITTHSPQVINHVASDRIRILTPNEVTGTNYGYGMPTQIVLKDIMGIEYEQPRKVEDAIRDAYNAIATGNSEAVQKAISILENSVPGHPELTRIQKVVERNERMHR